MFEDNYYEPIAEIYLTLSGQPNLDDIYCLYSRVFVEGAIKKDEDVHEYIAGEGESIEEAPKTGQSGESSVRLCNSSTESQVGLIQTPKKSHDEIVSCYCSASHYSTDEHDSLRDSILHHSDSGADLSESSRDFDWERYWTLHGERLIWESWISKYGSYIDPNYLSSGCNIQRPAEGDEASFCVQGDSVLDPNQRTSFAGLLDNVKSDFVNSDDVDDHQNYSEDVKSAETDKPKILVEIVKIDAVEISNRRLSDISETAKSISERSEDSSNVDDNDRLRLSVFSRCSGSSAPLSATTDSMTNVTRITLSSSDSSYGIDDSSAKSSSVLSSSDSAHSVDQQWQLLWADHFNEQYNYHFNIFNERHKKKECGEEVKSDSGFIIEDSKLSHNKQSDSLHQESIDEVGSIETQESISESDLHKSSSVPGSSKSSTKSEKSKKYFQKQRLLSVGYLLQQLNSMSVESTERIEEEESGQLSRPSTMENVKSVFDSQNMEEYISCCEISKSVNQAEKMEDNGLKNDSKDSSQCGLSSQHMEENDDLREVEIMEGDCDRDEDSMRHGVKRCHESEGDDSSIEKVKSAYQLMGFMYDMGNSKNIRKASVWYKKRFSQIRFQNRILRLQKPPNKHIYFDDDDEVCEESSHQLNSSDARIQDKNDSGEIFVDAEEEQSSKALHSSPETRKLEMEDFSEKDDSTDDDQEIYFSAEEDNLLGEERRDKKLKSLPKRRRKRQLKKKYDSYPQEMIDNPKIKKFWQRRYSLFSKFDEGIKMDAESWYSVTPEKIAVNIAERCQCDLVVDAFCGAGGNAIQLAFTCERVIAIDIDPFKIELARHNARVYGVEDRIEFIVGDFLQLAPTLLADVVFLSPPWGGPSYNRRAVFPLSSLLPVSGHQLLNLAADITENIAFYLPKNINTHELVECAGPGGSVEVVQNFLDRELIAVTAYYGELVNSVE